MGVTKVNVTARISKENRQHVLDLMLSRWPNLSFSAAVDLVLEEHRLLMAAGILTRAIESWQRKPCLRAEDILGIADTPVKSEGQSKDVKSFAYKGNGTAA